jgi:hypothetical protein
MNSIKIAAALVLIISAPFAVAAVDDPRLAKPELSSCVDTAKSFLRSNEVDDQEEEVALISACKDVDSTCVRAVGENLTTSESGYSESFLPVIKSCRGAGMGSCYKASTAKMNSFDYRDASQIKEILKKCE